LRDSREIIPHFVNQEG